MTKHTATPWILTRNKKGVTTEIEHVGSCEKLEDALHIVHCVNNHDALVRALELILPMAKGYIHNHFGNNESFIKQAEQALSNAKKEG